MTSFQGHARTIKQVLFGSHIDRIENYLHERHIRTMYEMSLCETGDSHSGVNEYKILEYNVSMGKQLLTFVKPLLPL
jgi:predicted SpoU family rRNA methylase